MQHSLVVIFLICGVGFCAAHSTRFSEITLDTVLGNDDLLDDYANCLLQKGPCTSQGAELKKYIVDEMKTNCSTCTSQQKADAKRVICVLIKKKNSQWYLLEDRYIPYGSYRNSCASKNGSKVTLSSWPAAEDE